MRIHTASLSIYFLLKLSFVFFYLHSTNYVVCYFMHTCLLNHSCRCVHYWCLSPVLVLSGMIRSNQRHLSLNCHMPNVNLSYDRDRLSGSSLLLNIIIKLAIRNHALKVTSSHWKMTNNKRFIEEIEGVLKLAESSRFLRSLESLPHWKSTVRWSSSVNWRVEQAGRLHY